MRKPGAYGSSLGKRVLKMPSDFSIPQRQDLLGVLVYFVKNGRALVSLLIVLFATAGKFENGTLFLILGVLFITSLVLVISYLQYLKFTFHIEDREIIIHHGVLFREKRIIPLERIQSVHLHQNLIQQILGLVGLKIDTAGSGQQELEISALKEKTARAFQEAIQQGPGESEEAVSKSEPKEPEGLLALSFSDLIKIGLSENHLRSGLFALALVFGYYSQYSQYLQDYLADYLRPGIEDVFPQIFRLGMVLVITGVAIFIILSILISLIRTIVRFFNFRVWLQQDIIGLSSGLLRKVEYRIPVAKVQYLVWSGNPLRRLLGFKSILVKQAAAEESGGRSQQKIEIPSCREEQSRALEAVVFGRQVSPGPNQVRANAIPYVLISFYIGAGLAAVFITGSWMLGRVFFWPVLLLVPTLVFLSYKYAKSVLIDIQEDVVIIHKGWIFPRRFVLPVYKAQSVSFIQSVFLKRRGLATLGFYTASGWVSARFLPEESVKLLYNFILFKTESHRGSWM